MPYSLKACVGVPRPDAVSLDRRFVQTSLLDPGLLAPGNVNITSPRCMSCLRAIGLGVGFRSFYGPAV